MNQLQPLIKQCYSEIHECPGDMASVVFDKEKFAELIIHECGKVMMETDSFYGDWMYQVAAKHFNITPIGTSENLA